MKNRFVILFSSFLLLLLSCKKQENKIYYENGTAPVLTSTPTGSIPLSFANKDQQAVKFNWTNPNYQFTTGTNSQNVNYKVEIDTTGSNFSNPARKVISMSNDLSLSIT